MRARARVCVCVCVCVCVRRRDGESKNAIKHNQITLKRSGDEKIMLSKSTLCTENAHAACDTHACYLNVRDSACACVCGICVCVCVCVCVICACTRRLRIPELGADGRAVFRVVCVCVCVCVRARARVLPTLALFGFAKLREPDSGHYSRVRGQLDSRYQLQLMFVCIFFYLLSDLMLSLVLPSSSCSSPRV